MALAIVPIAPPLRANADGVVLVANTRVPLDTLVYAFHEGATPEEIVQRYPSLTLVDVYAAIAYYLQHAAEVDAYLRERELQAEQVRRQNESRFDPTGIRSRLLARIASRSDGNPN